MRRSAITSQQAIERRRQRTRTAALYLRLRPETLERLDAMCTERRLSRPAMITALIQGRIR